MRYIDVTAPLNAVADGYPGDPEVAISRWSSVEAGADFTVSSVRFGSHSGTHVDAPLHCFAGGRPVDQLPLDILCGPAWVLELRAEVAGWTIATALARLTDECTRLLLKSSSEASGSAAVDRSGPLDAAAARSLIESGVRLVGTDCLSIAAGDELEVHRLLLGAGIVIIESLDLHAVEGGAYGLLCLPLKLSGCDGAPARVVLTRND